MALLMLPSMALNAGSRAGLRPEPVTIGSCVQPASATPLKPPSPSATTRAPRVAIRRVTFLMFFFVNRRTRRSFMR